MFFSCRCWGGILCRRDSPARILARPRRGYAPGEEVKLYATALPGYKFIGWRGDGEAWVQEDEPGGPYAGNPDPLGQIEDDTIFLRMGEGYEPPQVRKVTAVFERIRECLVVKAGNE